jgi:tetratricopeptide (TPR) repeat protein
MGGDMVPAAQQAFFTVFGVIAVLFILAWPAYRIVSMWLMRELSAGEAIGALVVLLAFLAGIITTWGTAVSGLLLLLLAALAGTIWFAGRTRDRRRLDRFFHEDVAASERALAKDPTNAAAHMRLAQLYEARGDLDTAIHHYEEAARLVPRDSEARLALGNAIERQRREALHSLTCFSCGTENAPTASHCRECGAMISGRNQLIGWLTQPPFGTALPWVGAAWLVLAVTGSLLRAIPLGITALAYLLLFASMLCYVYPRWARRREVQGR